MHRLDIGALGWVRPHHALYQVEQFRATAKVYLAEIFLSQAMPAISPTKGDVSSPEHLSSWVYSLIRYDNVCCRFEHRHAETGG
jgi:hypothetical protein